MSARIGPDGTKNAQGRYIYCYKQPFTLTAYVTGPIGNYTYYWEVSFNNGVSYQPTGGTSSTLTQNYYTIGNFYYRLTVTGPGNQVRVVYYPITVTVCNYSPFHREAHASYITGIQSVSPNPAADKLTVSYSLATDDKVSISLYDMQGRLVRNILNNASMEKGQQHCDMTIEDVANGIYQLRFITLSGSTEIPKVIVKH